MLKYDAKANQRQFVVRDPQFTRFVSIVTSAIVQGIVEANLPAGTTAPPAEADVQGAALLITPAPGTVHTELEVIARLHVTYLAPQKSGSPKLAALINNDLTFVGEPESLAPEAAGRMIETAFGAYIPDAKKQSVKAGEQVRQPDEPEFAALLRRLRISPAAAAQADAIVDRTQNPPVVYIRPGAPPYTSAHEATYLYQSDTFRSLGRGLSRGLTHVLAEQATADRATGKSRFDFRPSYGREAFAARALTDGYGHRLVLAGLLRQRPGGDQSPL